MSKVRDSNIPQHHLSQGHYGDLDLNELPDATGYPSGTAFIWDGSSWYYGEVQVGSGSSSDEKVKVTSNDTTANYLYNKLVAGTNVTIVENNNGGDETVTIQVVSGSATDELVKVSSNDTTASYLRQKVSGTSGITAYEYYNGSNELLVLSGSGAIGQYGSVPIIIGNGVNVITTGVKGYMRVPFNCTIVRATMLADISGSCVIDVWKDAYSNYPPTNEDSITASAPPTLSSQISSEDTTLSGWTVLLNQGDCLGFNVDSATTVKQVTLDLRVLRT